LRQDKTGLTTKRECINRQPEKKNITMMELIAWSSGMAMVFTANPSQQPLCNGLVEGADKRFYLIL
jgi:hypothetical protein